MELAAKAAPRDSVVRELEALLPQGTETPEPPDGLIEVIRSARERWSQAPELPRHMQIDLAARYHQALGRLVGAWPAAFGGTDLDPEVTRKRMEKLVAKVEESLSGSAGKAAAERELSPTERLAQQLRERLATNTITGGRTAENEEARWRAAEQEVRSAQAQWSRLGPVPAELAGPLNERFQRACRRFYDQRKRSS